MNIGFWKLCYFILAAAGMALCLYFGDSLSAGIIAISGFMVAQA